VYRYNEIVQTSEVAPPTPGRPRSEAARRAVLHAVDDMLVEVGYAAMTMKGIAERAGVGRQTVYRWWSTKAQILLEACVDDARSELTTPRRGMPNATSSTTWWRSPSFSPDHQLVSPIVPCSVKPSTIPRCASFSVLQTSSPSQPRSFSTGSGRLRLPCLRTVSPPRNCTDRSSPRC